MTRHFRHPVRRYLQPARLHRDLPGWFRSPRPLPVYSPQISGYTRPTPVRQRLPSRNQRQAAQLPGLLRPGHGRWSAAWPDPVLTRCGRCRIGLAAEGILAPRAPDLATNVRIIHRAFRPAVGTMHFHRQTPVRIGVLAVIIDSPINSDARGNTKFPPLFSGRQTEPAE